MSKVNRGAADSTKTWGRRYRKRRKSKHSNELKGEYTTWKMLHVMTWLKAANYEQLTVAEIAKGCSLSEDAVGKILRELKKRRFAECVKPEKRSEKRGAKRIYHKDRWILTAPGEKHWWAEMQYRTYTKRFDDLAKIERWRIILRDVETIRLAILPRVKKLVGRSNEPGNVYRIDRLIQTRPVKYLIEALDMAVKAECPAAYFVASCIGSLTECLWKRAYAYISKHPFWQKNHYWILEFYGYLKLQWADPFAAARYLTPFIKKQVSMTGKMDSDVLAKGYINALGVPGCPFRYPIKTA